MIFPLTLANEGERLVIEKISGRQETKSQLKKMGFLIGSQLQVISNVNENVIIQILDSRLALGASTAKNIYVKKERLI